MSLFTFLIIQNSAHFFRDKWLPKFQKQNVRKLPWRSGSMQASGSVDPGSIPSWAGEKSFLQKWSEKSEQNSGLLRKVVNSYFKKILVPKWRHKMYLLSILVRRKSLKVLDNFRCLSKWVQFQKYLKLHSKSNKKA